MRGKTLNIILIIGLGLLIALSVANLIISKTRTSEVDRLIDNRVSEILQSPDFQRAINTSIQDTMSKIVTDPQKGDKGDPGQSNVGPQGIQGKDGTNGMNGKDGKNGDNGKNGKDGNQGVPGATLELQWGADGTLQSRYIGDDFWRIVPTEQPPTP